MLTLNFFLPPENKEICKQNSLKYKIFKIYILRFFLQNQNTLSQVSEKIIDKPSSVQQKFFQLVEFPVHQLHYIPTKELIG